MMKVLILLAVFFCSLPFLRCQTSISIVTDDNELKTIIADTSEACNPSYLFTIVPIMPKYKGGIEQLIKELNANIDIDHGVRGNYSVYFSVNCEDKAYGFQTINSIDEELDENIIGLLDIQQNWISAIHRERKVDCTYVITMKIKRGKLIFDRR